MIAVGDDEELLAIARIRQCWLARDRVCHCFHREVGRKRRMLCPTSAQTVWFWYGRKLSFIHLRVLHGRDAATTAESETRKEAQASGSKMASVGDVPVSWKEPSRGQLVAEGLRKLMYGLWPRRKF